MGQSEKKALATPTTAQKTANVAVAGLKRVHMGTCLVLPQAPSQWVFRRHAQRPGTRPTMRATLMAPLATASCATFAGISKVMVDPQERL